MIFKAEVLTISVYSRYFHRSTVNRTVCLHRSPRWVRGSHSLTEYSRI